MGAGSAHLLLSGFLRAPVSQAAAPLSAVTKLVLDSATGSSISQLTNLWLAFLDSDAQLDVGAVLVFSSLGISRSSTATMAYLMHSCRFSLQVRHCQGPTETGSALHFSCWSPITVIRHSLWFHAQYPPDKGTDYMIWECISLRSLRRCDFGYVSPYARTCDMFVFPT